MEYLCSIPKELFPFFRSDHTVFRNLNQNSYINHVLVAKRWEAELWTEFPWWCGEVRHAWRCYIGSYICRYKARSGRTNISDGIRSGSLNWKKWLVLVGGRWVHPHWGSWWLEMQLLQLLILHEKVNMNNEDDHDWIFWQLVSACSFSEWTIELLLFTERHKQ